LDEKPCELSARKVRTRSAEAKTHTVKEEKEQKDKGSEIVKAENLRQDQRNDGELKRVIEWLEDAEQVPTASELRTHSLEVQQLWAQRPSLSVREGILYRKFVKPDGSLQHWQIIVPKSLRIAFLDVVHLGAWNGHPGIERTRLKLQEIAYWRGWTTDVYAYVQRCLVCTTHRPGPRRKQGQMQRAQACDIMQKVHVDLVGPFPTSQRGYKYLLTAICGFSKYLICVPIRDKVSQTVANVLMKQLYLVHGPPEILVHDQGDEFWSEVMRSWLNCWRSNRPNSQVIDRVLMEW